MKRLIPVVVSGAIVAALFTVAGTAGFGRLLREADSGGLALGALAFAGTLALRGWRVAFIVPRLSDRRFGYMDGFDVSSVNNLLNHLLPFRMGELSFIFFLTIVYKLPLSRATLALLVARVYDLIGLLMVILAGVSWLGLSQSVWWFAGAGAGIAGLGFVAVKLDFTVAVARGMLSYMLRFARLEGRRLPARLLELMDRVVVEVKPLLTPGAIAVNLLLSWSLWLTLILCFHILLAAFGLGLPFAKVMVGSAGATLSGILPINGAGSIGTLEAGWAAGFIAMGLPRADAIASGFAMHVVVIGVSALFAMVSFLRQGPRTWEAFVAWRKRGQPS